MRPRRPRVRSCRAPLQLRRLRQLLQGAPPRAHLGMPLELTSSASSTARIGPRCSATSTPPCGSRPSCSTTAGRWRSRTRSSGTSPTAPSTSHDRYERAQVLQWQFFEQYQHEPTIAVVRFLIAYSGEAGEARGRIKERRVRLRRARRDGAALDGRTFLVGERYTVADISLYAYTHVARRGRLRPRAATPRSAPGSSGSPRSPGTSRSTRERRPFASASHRARPGRSTSATRSARSPTATFADDHGGMLVLRIDDTDPSARSPGGEEAILADLGWLGDRRGTRGRSGRASGRSATPRRRGCALEPERSGTPTARSASPGRRSPGRTARATYQLATVVDDLDLGITHIIRGSDHRPNEEVHQRIARRARRGAPGGDPPRAPARGRRQEALQAGRAASVADLRDEGIPAAAVRAYLDELGLPRHDVSLDLAAHPAARDRRDRGDARRRPRGGRRSASASSRARSAAPARSSRRARSRVRSSSRAPCRLGEEARPTLERFVGAPRSPPRAARRAERACDRPRAQGGRAAASSSSASRSPVPSAVPSCGPSSPPCRATRRSAAPPPL